MTDLLKLMEMKPETLAEEQYKAFRAHVLGVLRSASDRIRGGNFDSIEKLCFFSPAGDGHGSDDHCLDFGYKPGQPLNIIEACNRLEELRALAKPE